MTQHTTAQKKGEMKNGSRQISTRARVKVIRFMERCGLRLSGEEKRMRGSGSSSHVQWQKCHVLPQEV